MKDLKEELLSLAQSWNASGEHDGTTLEERYFMSDAALDDFARNHELIDQQGNFSVKKIESACDCRVVYDYVGANPNRQFGDQEIIFNGT